MFFIQLKQDKMTIGNYNGRGTPYYNGCGTPRPYINPVK